MGQDGLDQRTVLDHYRLPPFSIETQLIERELGLQAKQSVEHQPIRNCLGGLSRVDLDLKFAQDSFYQLTDFRDWWGWCFALRDPDQPVANLFHPTADLDSDFAESHDIVFPGSKYISDSIIRFTDSWWGWATPTTPTTERILQHPKINQYTGRR